MEKFKKMREYTHEEFVKLVENLNENELLELSKNYGGYPVLFRMALDERIKHIPFIQTGSAVIVKNENDEILLQERTDRALWSIPGGCQELGERLEETALRELYEETGIKLKEEDLTLIDNVSGASRKEVYPNKDVVYNNTSLYLAEVSNIDLSNLNFDDETKSLKFVKLDEIPDNMLDKDLIEAYKKYLNNIKQKKYR